MIPGFYDGANLPEGLYLATLEEVIGHFGGGPRRSGLCGRLQTLVERARECNFRKVVLFGSFISSKAEPGDLDLFWTLPTGIDTDSLSNNCRQLIDSQNSRTLFECDIFWCFDEDDAIERMAKMWGFDRKGQKRGLIVIDLK